MKVSGKISDSYGALDGATIVLLRNGKRTNLATISNQEGNFEIENDEIKSNDEFEIRYLGLETVFKKAKDLKNADIFLKESTEELDEVVVTAGDNKDENSETSDYLEKLLSDIGKKPNTPIKKGKKEWYKSTPFLISVLGIVTIGTIIVIIKKTR